MNRRFMKKVTAILCTGLVAASGLTGCGVNSGSKDTVPVQLVSSLAGLNISGQNHYMGVVEAKTTQKIEKDADKTVKKCYVKVGDKVKKGQILFTYDLDDLNLQIETKKLELEQIQASIESTKNQITELEKERANASSNEKLSYTLEIQEAELEIQENEYNLKTKQAELKKFEKGTKKTEVRAKVSGVVQSVNEANGGGSDDEDEGYYDDDYSGGGSSDSSYITIMETGTYQIKGTVTESNVASLYEGMPVLVKSRTEKDKTWTATITSIDQNSGESNSSDEEDYGYDEGGNSGESATQYTFISEIKKSDGLMMGQHVYLMPYEEGTFSEDALVLPAVFFYKTDDTAFCYVASSKNTIEKREVTLGTYDSSSDTYEITDGLSLDDYIAEANPEPEEGAQVVKFDTDDHTVYSQDRGGKDKGEGESEEYDEEPMSGDDMEMNEDYSDDMGLDEEYEGDEGWDETAGTWSEDETDWATDEANEEKGGLMNGEGAVSGFDSDAVDEEGN